MSDILIEEMEDNGANIPSEELFYIAPSGRIYNEMLGLAMDIWQWYDDTYWYATEKIEYINWLKNIWSNFMTIYWMFDFMNQMTLKYRASDELKREIENRTN